MIRNSALALFFMSSGFARAESDLATTLSKLNGTSVEKVLLGLDPDFVKSPIVVPDSGSLQNGLRILMPTVDGRRTVTYNLEAGKRGYNAIEFKEFDGKTFRYGELKFESGASHLTPASQTSCAECHVADQTRFDIRQYRQQLDILTPEQKKQMIELLNDQSNPRVRYLQLNHRLGLPPNEPLSMQNFEKFKSAMMERSLKMSSTWAELGHTLITEKVLALVAKSPRLHLQVLAALKDCDMGEMMTPLDLKSRADYFSRASGRISQQRVAIATALKVSDSAKAVDLILESIKSRQASNVKSHFPGSLPDLISEPQNRVLAKLTLLIDPAVERAAEDFEVKHWHMGLHVTGFYFNGKVTQLLGTLESALNKKLLDSGIDVSGAGCKEILAALKLKNEFAPEPAAGSHE